jgi:hypothetical protein
MKFIFFLFGFLFVFATSYSQNITGKWKLTEAFIEHHAGPKEDLVKDMLEEYPCFKKIVYVFSANGKITVEKNGCESVDEDEALEFGTRWKLMDNGKKIIVDDEEIETDEEADTESGEEIDADDTIIYQLKTDKNSMTWHIDYAYKNGDKTESVKKIYYRFEKVL